MKLLVKRTDDDGRYASLPGFLTTAWDIQVVDVTDREAFARALSDADAMISMAWSAAMPPAPKLKLVHLPGAGTDEIDFAALPPHTSVCNAYEHEIGIAEYTIAVLLEFEIRLARLDAALRRDEWYGSWMCGPLHGELYGKTIGIVGYGRIGREVAKRAKAFGMDVLAVSRTARDSDGWVERVEPMSALHAMLARAHYVVIALPLDAATRSAIDAAAFGAMRPDAVLVNVCRGPVVDEDALWSALSEKRIRGAAIDTWYQYPKPGERYQAPSRHRFADLDNVLMTGHASAWTTGLLPRRCRVIATNLDRLARGEPFVNCVRKGEGS